MNIIKQPSYVCRLKFWVPSLVIGLVALIVGLNHSWEGLQALGIVVMSVSSYGISASLLMWASAQTLRRIGAAGILVGLFGLLFFLQGELQPPLIWLFVCTITGFIIWLVGFMKEFLLLPPEI